VWRIASCCVRSRLVVFTDLLETLGECAAGARSRARDRTAKARTLGARTPNAHPRPTCPATDRRCSKPGGNAVSTAKPQPSSSRKVRRPFATACCRCATVSARGLGLAVEAIQADAGAIDQYLYPCDPDQSAPTQPAGPNTTGRSALTSSNRFRALGTSVACNHHFAQDGCVVDPCRYLCHHPITTPLRYRPQDGSQDTTAPDTGEPQTRVNWCV
jgi:hypothetical protein